MNSLFPLVLCEDLVAERTFATSLLGLQVVFENDWYVQLQLASNPAVQLAYVQADHPSVPEPYQARAAGVIVTVELDDVDDVYKRAQEVELGIVQPLRDEPWGQRHFMVASPSGVLLDLVKLIPPTAEFEAGYQTDD